MQMYDSIYTGSVERAVSFFLSLLFAVCVQHVCAMSGNSPCCQSLSLRDSISARSSRPTNKFACWLGLAARVCSQNTSQSFGFCKEYPQLKLFYMNILK